MTVTRNPLTIHLPVWQTAKSAGIGLAKLAAVVAATLAAVAGMGGGPSPPNPAPPPFPPVRQCLCPDPAPVPPPAPVPLPVPPPVPAPAPKPPKPAPAVTGTIDIYVVYRLSEKTPAVASLEADLAAGRAPAGLDCRYRSITDASLDFADAAGLAGATPAVLLMDTTGKVLGTVRPPTTAAVIAAVRKLRGA